jgi:DNA-binding NtrC family response regulator
LKSFQRNTQPATFTELQTVLVPLRVLVSEPDITSRRLICALLQSDGDTTVTCVEDSQLLSAIDEAGPHIVIVDAHSPSIRRALNWEALGIEEAPATIVTGFDPSSVSTFASNAVDFRVKPFDVERLESALALAIAAEGQARSAAEEKCGAHLSAYAGQPRAQPGGCTRSQRACRTDRGPRDGSCQDQGSIAESGGIER